MRNMPIKLAMWNLVIVAIASGWSQAMPQPPAFQLARNPQTGFVSSLRCSGDLDPVEFIRPGSSLGPVRLRVRAQSLQGNGPWLEVTQSTNVTKLCLLDLFSRMDAVADSLAWEVTVRNATTTGLEIGDLELPLPMNTDYVTDPEETFRHRLFKHAFIAGAGSFIYWIPVKGTGSILLLQPDAGTSLEFFHARGMDYARGREEFSVFVHSKASAQTAPQGSWRQTRTSRMLRPGECITNRLTFRFAEHYQDVRDHLYRNGGVDVQVAPGMVVPRDLTAMIALRTRLKVEKLAAEFPDQTRVEYVGPAPGSNHVYRVKFKKLGENLLTLRGAGGWSMPLEFFVTEPLETLIRKRSAFIVHHQQHRDPALWYDGLFSLWDRRHPDGRGLLGPDHTGGLNLYTVSGSDDPSNSKGLLVGQKNVAFPDAAEIEALEYYVQHFVWGKLQRTNDEKPYPYGVYGSDSWKQNRFTDRDILALGVSRPGGPSACRMWRTYDYTTLFALYFDLYRIARQRPDLVKLLDAAGYLERAFGTARAFFEVPAGIRMEGGWSFKGWVDWQYTTGNFHEKYLLPIIAALEQEGHADKAKYLRGEWEKKVKYFIYDNPSPFASEMPIDSTAYESTYAAAAYALGHGLQADTNLWRDPNHDRWYSHPVIDPSRHKDFLERQHAANLACRGVLEANSWSLGSDFRGSGSASYTLSYMSQMGGWSVLDYALHFDPQPAANLRLGYASMLSSWALLNSGDSKSNFGFWTPGPQDDGAMSWGFQPRQSGPEWAPTLQHLSRGAWPVCGEADHGLVAGIESACTVLFDDPLFGLMAYGGDVRQSRGMIKVIPRDGVRQRFYAMIDGRRLQLSLDRDGFAAHEPLLLNQGLDRIRFSIENRAPQAHPVRLSIEGLPAGDYRILFGTKVIEIHAAAWTAVEVPISLPCGRGARVDIEPHLPLRK
jgi:hypothetical protein